MRKSITFATLVSTVLILSFAAFAGTVYEDDFSGSSISWAEITPNNVPKDISSGKLSTSNSGGTLAILKHDDSNINKLTDFTYSVELEKVNGEVNTSGIMFCFPSTGIGGYQFYVREDGLFGLVRWDGSTPTNLSVGDGRTSFRNAEKVKLTVSKSGSTISLFCDNEFLGSIVDATHSKGDICLIVGAGESVSFDNVRVTDDTKTGEIRTGFYDDFKGAELKTGWAKYSGNGTYSIEDSSISISNDIQLWTTGNYDAVACTMVVSYLSGDSTAFYGLNLVGQSGELGRTFVINAKKYFGVYSGTGNAKVNSNITGTSDEIIITADHHLIVNGQMLDDVTFTSPGDFRGVALYAQPGVTARVEKVSFGNNESNPIAHKSIKFTGSTQEYEIGGTGLIYDVRGRQVAKFEKENYKNTLKELGAGQFFVIAKNKQHMIKRAIINVK